MSKRYQSSEENQAYKEGYRDNEQGRRDYYHDKYAMEGIDRAYWDGRKDQGREERERKEQEEMELQMQEDDARREEQRIRDEEEYNQYLQAKMEQQMEDDLATIPSTEEELFMQIEKDEREESINQKSNENEQKD